MTRAQANAVAELLRIAPIADRLGEEFAAAGHTLYLVGGSVRDALRGELGHDLDFTTDARPDDIEAILRTVSPAVWTIGKEFGTVGCRVDEAVAGPEDDGESVSWVIEVTTFRSDAYVADSRKPQVRFGDTLEGDLVRRDFTVNAMAVELPSKRFVDPYGGLAHLAAEVIDTPGTPEQSFSDDPLRMMRAARFTSQLFFTPAPRVIAAMTAMADRIAIVSAERIRDELSKLLLTDRPRAGTGAAGAHRAGRSGAARAAGAPAGARRAPPAQGRVRAQPDRARAGHRPGVAVARLGRTWSAGWPRCCTTSASRPPGSSRRAARCRSTTTTWSARSWRRSG